MKNTILILTILLSGYSTTYKAQSTDPYIGQILWVSFDFAPTNWMGCDGQILLISQYTALFSLLGTTYGGDGKSTFALPNLNGRTMIFDGAGPGLISDNLGVQRGNATETLLLSQIPSHSHTIKASTQPGDTSEPQLAVPANTGKKDFEYQTTLTSSTTMNPLMVSLQGGNQPHENMQPYLTLKCIIATAGIIPPRNY